MNILKLLNIIVVLLSLIDVKKLVVIRVPTVVIRVIIKYLR